MIKLFPLFLLRTHMRYLYTLLVYLAVPYALLRLWWRSYRLPIYRERLLERLGFYPVAFKECIWLHGVSVGEILAAVPVVNALLAENPSCPFVITTMTPTGAERVKHLWKDRVIHLYLPYDMPFSVEKFLKATQPKIGILMETELWPNLLRACHKKKIPICLLNARLSERSAKRYAKIPSLTKEMLENVNAIAVQSELEHERFVALGASRNRLTTVGNVKFDLHIPREVIEQGQALRKNLGEKKFVWIAASTHKGEEELMLTAHSLVCEIYPDAVLILVPRHPDRFESVYQLIKKFKFTVLKRSETPCFSPSFSVYLGDTMGELLQLYAASDIAFVGGSLIPQGGHNMLEPAALAKPILTGKYLFNFTNISEQLISAQALLITLDAEALAEQLLKFANNAEELQQVGEKAKQVFLSNQGSLAKQMTIVNKILTPCSAE